MNEGKFHLLFVNLLHNFLEKHIIMKCPLKFDVGTWCITLSKFVSGSSLFKLKIGSYTDLRKKL